jgi:hypothetical protein
MITGYGRDAAQETRRAIEAGARTLFQATAISADGCLVMADILQREDDGEMWALSEVKSSTQVKDEHITDVAFQWHVFQQAGYQLSKASIVHVDNSVVRRGPLLPESISVSVDVTRQVQDRLAEISTGVEKARQIIESASPPSPDNMPCMVKPADCSCPEYCYPGLPEFSVFSLPRIRFADAQQLYQSDIVSVTDITEIDSLTEKQQLHVRAAQSGAPIIERRAIREFLGQLNWPLNFLDYETVNPALPMFDSYHPYEQVVFQYSLHTLNALDAGPHHAGFLGDGTGDPSQLLASQLQHDLPDSGSVLVWNKSFEMARNRELATRCPEFSAFFNELNDRIIDLMDIVRNGYYVDAGFCGSASIKKVLPVLVPTLDYTALDISDGLTASTTWHRMVSGSLPEDTESIRSKLIEYCHLDTLALVELVRFFGQI